MATRTATPSVQGMQAPTWNGPARWWVMAVAVVIGVVAAIGGLWWSTAGMAVLVVGHLADIVRRRRREAERDFPAGA